MSDESSGGKDFTETVRAAATFLLDPVLSAVLTGELLSEKAGPRQDAVAAG